MPDSSVTERLHASPRHLRIFAWMLAAAISLVSVYIWGDLYNWHMLPYSSYTFFPLFGLLAFGLMWSHYMVAVARQITGFPKTIIKRYYKATSIVVLASILLHPGLFIWQLFLDGYGLPPGSYKAYVGASMTWLVILGAISLFVFLAFELHRVFGDRSWWKYVGYANDVAMLAIFYHGLQLGSHLQSGWFRGLWLLYGILLVPAIVYLKIIIPRRSNS